MLEKQQNIADQLPRLVTERWRIPTETSSKPTINETTLLNLKIFRSPGKKQSKRKAGKGCFDEESNPFSSKAENLLSATLKSSENKKLGSINLISKSSNKKSKHERNN